MLISPYGAAELSNLYLSPDEAEAESARAKRYPSWDLLPTQLGELELLLSGAFTPLLGFLGRRDYESVLNRQQLVNGLFWPWPITLDVTRTFADTLTMPTRIALRDGEGVLVAVMQVDDMWTPDRAAEANELFPGDASAATHHIHSRNDCYVGGAVHGVKAPHHYDFRLQRHSPRELRESFAKRGWTRVAAFQTNAVMHRADAEASFRAARDAEANLLIHGLIASGEEADAKRYARVRCYHHILNRLPRQTTMLSLFPLQEMAECSRSRALRTIMARNFGCSHLVEEHRGVSAKALQFETGVETIVAPQLVYVKERGQFVEKSAIQKGETAISIEGGDIASRLDQGIAIEEWCSYPEVIAELRKVHPPRGRQGFTVFFTGLSGAGKSTLANALRVRLLEMGGRHVTLLDGDIVRKNLSSELGFSRAHRDLNILRIGFVASEITKNGGVAVCAPIAPYAATRRRVRAEIERLGGFVEVHVATPIEECERRDRKGLYAKARAGLLKGFTGVDDPYEAPLDPEFVIDTSRRTPDEAVQDLILKLEKLGYIELRARGVDAR